MEGTSAFSSEDDVTKKRIDTVSKPSTEADKLGEVYEVDRCREWIQGNGFKKVALQFPDERLVDSVSVQASLQRGLDPSTAVFILGDTSYGSCCVDEVAAEHYQADSVIHFGPACLSPTQRLPVLHVLCSQPVDLAHAAQQLHSVVVSSLSSSPGGGGEGEGGGSHRVIVMADTMFQHAVEPLAECLRAAGVEAMESYLQLPSSCSSPSTDAEGTTTTTINSISTTTPTTIPTPTTTSTILTPNTHNSITQNSSDTTEADSETNTKNDNVCWHCQCNRKFRLPAGCSSLEDCSVCYIGGEGRVLTNLMMTLNKSQFFSYDPESRIARRETLNVNRELMKRYYMIERAKEARIVGVVAGTLGVSRTCEIIAHLKSLAKGAGKKTYTFVVGKLNVPKLANFMEVDVFVLVACPLNTLLDSKDFLKPVVTPFEMEVACNQAREWTGQYVTDFIQLLPGAADHVTSVAAEEDTADVSLISNKLVSLGQRSSTLLAQEGQESSALIARSDAMALTSVSANTAGEFLSSRSWQGLDRQLGQTAVEKAKEGRSGIPVGYENEPK